MRKRIAILGYDGVAAINVVGPLEAFSNARHHTNGSAESACYDVSVIACAGNQFVSNTRVTFQGRSLSSDSDDEFDTIIVPGGTGLQHPETCAEVGEWVMTHARRARRIATICTGIYALASTGLVDGRRITTHWERARDLAQRFPKLKVEESALFIKDGRFYSSAGATAGIDLSLALIAEDFGKELAERVARCLLVYLVRDGGQEQYSEPATFEVKDNTSQDPIYSGRLRSLVRWMQRHLGEDLSLAKLAKRALLTKPNFVTQFSQTFGVPPGLFVKNLRFNEARRRLTRGEKSLDVASFLGFRDAAYFIQEFRRRFGCLPDDYQRRFGPVEAAGTTETFAESELIPVRAPVREVRALGKPAYQRPRIVSFTRCIRAPRARPNYDHAVGAPVGHNGR
ncbi:MAG: GlxA family transcriptional regulator [Chthoniobacterales bacterium]